MAAYAKNSHESAILAIAIALAMGLFCLTHGQALADTGDLYRTLPQNTLVSAPANGKTNTSFYFLSQGHTASVLSA